LFHGTFLLHFDLDLMSRVLRAPSRPPEYRARRSHDRFAMNLGIEAAALKGMLRETWKARERFGPLPGACLDTLLRERYRRPEWHERLEAGRRDG
jgi:lipoate-protein ligase A